LNNVKALAKYAFFALLLAPLSAASLGAIAIGGEYWIAWRICFLTEALALLTLTPAILGWADVVRTHTQKRLMSSLEATALLTGLVAIAYFTFVVSDSSDRPALLYALVPFLVWSALRFGTAGISNSMVVIAFFSIWGAIHGRGPFSEGAPSIMYCRYSFSCCSQQLLLWFKQLSLRRTSRPSRDCKRVKRGFGW